VSTNLPGAPAFGSLVVKTNSQGRDFAIVGAGISATPSELYDNIAFFLNYDAQVGQDNYISHTANGGLRVGL
jgi:outer membrane autotransporter protein